MLMNIQEFAVLILKGARNRKKLQPQYLHGLNKHPPLARAPPKKCSTPVPVTT